MEQPRFPAQRRGNFARGTPAHCQPASDTGGGVPHKAADLCPVPHWGRPHWCLLQEELSKGMRGCSQDDLNH